MTRTSLLALLGTSVLFSSLSFAGEAGIGDLCKDGGVEGSYLAVKTLESVKTIGTPKSTLVRINLVCVSEEKMLASETAVLGQSGLELKMMNSTAVNLGHVVISPRDPNILEVSSFPENSEPRWEFPTAAIATVYLVNIAELRNHRFIASYDGRFSVGYGTAIGQLDMAFPMEKESAALSIKDETYKGTYYVKDSGFGEGYLKLGIAGSMPYATFLPKESGSPLQMVYAAEWGPQESHSTFTNCTSLGHGGEVDESKLWCVRGHFLDANHIQFHTIVPGFGLSSASTATRAGAFQGNVAELKVPSDDIIAKAIADNRVPPPATDAKPPNGKSKKPQSNEWLATRP